MRSSVRSPSDFTANFLPGHYDDSDDMQSRVQRRGSESDGDRGYPDCGGGGIGGGRQIRMHVGRSASPWGFRFFKGEAQLSEMGATRRLRNALVPLSLGDREWDRHFA